MRLKLFAGGSYQNPSLRANAQSSINVYPQTDKTTGLVNMIGAPGLSLFATLPTSPNRGIWMGEDRMFTVAGSKLYEVFQNGTNTQRGDVGNDGKPVQIFPNGNQLAIVSNGLFYVDSGAGPSQVSLPAWTGTAAAGSSIFPLSTFPYVAWLSGDLFDAHMVGQPFVLNGTTLGLVQQILNDRLLMIDTPVLYQTGNYTVGSTPIKACCGTFLDGYAVIAVPNSAQINVSALYDFRTWDRTDFSVAEGYPDHFGSVIANRTVLYLLKKQTLELWKDSGNADFPFERIPGEVIQIGAVAPNSPDKLLDGIALLGTDSRGGPMAFLIQGYQWKRISTPAIEAIWAKYSVVSDAVGFSYDDAGREFWQISFPTADATWCYDAIEDQWHQRGYYSGGVLHRTRAAFHGYVWGGHYVGDWNSGAIYKMSRDYYTDNTQPIFRQRTAAHLTDENKLTAYSDFVLDIQPGEIANAQFTFDYSVDGGVNFKAARTLTGGAINDTLFRFTERRLGTSRLRTFRVTSTAAMRHVWIDAYVEAQAAANGKP